MPALLFLCGGRRVELLRRFRAALDAHGGGRILTTDTEEYPATSFVADRTCRVPPCSDGEAFADAIAGIVDRERIDAVLPLRCAAVATVPLLRKRLGSKVISGDDHAVAVATDKREAYRHFLASDVASAEWVEHPSPSDLPLFFRPRRSEGSAEARAVRSAEELEQLAARDDAFFVRLLQGREVTIDCYRAADGTLLSVVPRDRLRVRAGEVERSVTRRRADVIASTARVLRSLVFTGPATVQAIVLPHGVFFTEINLRYGGGVTLSFAAGHDSAAWFVNEMLGKPNPVPAEPRWDYAMTRYDQEFYFSLP